MSEARIHVYETVVKPEWIDHNGHMNVAFFVLAFDEATDDVYEHWGIGMDYPDTSGCSVFTLGINGDSWGGPRASFRRPRLRRAYNRPQKPRPALDSRAAFPANAPRKIRDKSNRRRGSGASFQLS